MLLHSLPVGLKSLAAIVVMRNAKRCFGILKKIQNAFLALENVSFLLIPNIKPVQWEPLLVELTIVHYSVREADVFFYRAWYLKTYKNAD